tara:strand:+ start:388 stop:666 length:279 start_codon:yes stop_codon:yes gene_type:complete
MEGEIEVNLINNTIEDLKRIDINQQIIKLLADEAKVKQNRINMDRTEMIEKILDFSGDKFETKENFLELAKESSYQLMRRLIILKKSNKKQK